MSITVEAFPLVLSADEVRLQFDTLAAEWRKQVKFLSNLRQAVMFDSYQRIIGLGRPVVPVLLEELKRQPDWWFCALRAITGENPAPADAAGSLPKLAAAWVEWGRRRGLCE